jgi:phenylacetate-CoA ligase
LPADTYFEERIETLSRAELLDLQAKEFRAAVKYANSQSNLYRRAFERAKLDPDEIRGIEDLQKIKFFTTKDDLREAFPYGALAVSRDRVVEMHATSGTTGIPTLGLHTANDLESWGEIAARALVMSGLTRKDVFQITPSLGMFSGGFGFYHGARKVGCTIVPSSAGFSGRQIQFMKDFGTTMICAIVSYAFRLAEVASENGVDLKTQTKVRKGVFGSEIWTREMKRRITNLWDLDPYDIYGFTELCGPGVGNDCRLHDGIHIWQDHFLVEVVDPNTGEVLGPEEEGELVFTTLTKEAMPLIRYRSRDISALLDSPSCDCGRTHQRFKEIKGRTDDMIKFSGVNFWPSEVEAILLKEEGLGHEYRITISKESDSLDKMLIQVESKEKILDPEKKHSLAKKLSYDLHNSILFTPEIVILDPNSLPRLEVGKSKRVNDERRST